MKDRKRHNLLFLVLLLLASSLVLSGCMTSGNWVWQHPIEQDDQARVQAIIACEQIADDEVRRKVYYSPYRFPYYDRYYSRHDHYFYWPNDFFYNAHREFQDWNRYFRICMKAKGWRRVNISKPEAKQ